MSSTVQLTTTVVMTKTLSVNDISPASQTGMTYYHWHQRHWMTAGFILSWKISWTTSSYCLTFWKRLSKNPDTGSQFRNCTSLYLIEKVFPTVKKILLRDLTFFSFFHKRLRIFNRFFTHLLYVPIYARSQIFIQLSPTLTKLCHIKRDYPVHIICSKCPPSAETHAFRRLHKLLIALLIVVCGK